MPGQGTPKAGKRGGLTPQQRLFAHEYLVDRNAKQAAIRAGYSPRAAETNGPRLLRIAQVRELVDAGLQRLTERLDEKTEITKERVILELRRILQADPVEALNEDGSAKDLQDWPADLRRALSGFEVEELFAGRGEDRVQIGLLKKYRFWSKTESSQQILRVLGAFKDKVEHEHTFKSHAELAAEAVRRARTAAVEKKP